MGAVATKRWLCMRVQSVKVIVQGLNGSGKSSLIHLLKYNETLVRNSDVTTPINIANVETVEHRTANLVCWDIPSGEKVKSQYYEDSDAVIYVVDSCDRDRLDAVRKELELILTDEGLHRVPVLVVANKQDVTYALSAVELKEKLALNGNTANRDIQIKPASTLSGAGLTSAIDWLVECIHKYKSQTQTVKSGQNGAQYKAVVPVIPTNSYRPELVPPGQSYRPELHVPPSEPPTDVYRAEIVTGLPDIAMTTDTRIGNSAESYAVMNTESSAVLNTESSAVMDTESSAVMDTESSADANVSHVKSSSGLPNVNQSAS